MLTILFIIFLGVSIFLFYYSDSKKEIEKEKPDLIKVSLTKWLLYFGN